MLNRRLLLTSAMLALFIGNSALAECPVTSDARPAQLIDSELQTELIAGLVSDWTSDEPVRLVKFSAQVSRIGELEYACCMSSTYKRTAGDSLKMRHKFVRLRFLPATIQGRAVRVFVAFTIIARKTANGVQTELLLNHLNSMEEFGPEYSAPQRVWSTSMRSRRRLSAGEVYLDVQAMVDRSGRALGAEIKDSESDAGTFERVILSRMESACYIPGFHNGEAKEMLYSEGFANW